jgi:DNA-binding transcriptional ArsR family regulator
MFDRILFSGRADALRVPKASRFADLARNLEALASETRLELLHALRHPTVLQDIRVAPSLTRGTENPDRALSRQAVARHLEQLQAFGLVRRAHDDERRADVYVLNHERVFAVVDEMRALARLRPVLDVPIEPGETVDRGQGAAELPAGPRLLLAYGRDEGVAFALDRPPGARWRIGRGPECEVCLDYDPYLSTEHCIVARTSDAFTIQDAESRNGTWVNWVRLAAAESRPLAPGDLVTAGRTLLVFQP